MDKNSKILVLVVKNKEAIKNVEVNSVSFSRIITVCLKNSDADDVFNTVRRNASTFVSKAYLYPSINALSADLYSKLGSQDKNPHFFFKAASNDKDELKIISVLREELSDLVG